MTEIRHIVFDIGKVLIHYDPEHPVQPADPRRRASGAGSSTMSARIDWNIEQDRGRTWEEAEALLIAEHPGPRRKHPQLPPPLARDGAARL